MTEWEALLAMVKDLYENRLPFNRLLGLKVQEIGHDSAEFTFRMREEFVGNSVHGILHGGVISAVLDATGGMTATAAALGQMAGMDADEMIRRASRIGTIDLRVDYLRPGKGDRFHSRGEVMRTGNKVAVIRSELTNQDGLLIAAGTGAYLVG
ncbi:MAG: thioesterase family protein [Desulfobacterales bacterium]